jgi:hypothetical protein
MMRRSRVLAAALVAVALGGTVAATPAQAAPKVEGFVAISAYGHHSAGWFWIDEMEGIIGCVKCLHWFDFEFTHVLRPAEEAGINAEIMTALGRLGQARVADPRTAERLRAEALDHVTGAARHLGDAGVRAGAVGYYDPDRDATVETGSAWLRAATGEVAAALTALRDPAGGRAALAHLDRAYEAIATKRVAG